MITLEIVTLRGIVFSDEVYEVSVPTPDGEISIFDNHSSLVTLIEPGVIRIRSNSNVKDTDRELQATNGGVAEITKNRIRLLVDESEKSEEIDAQEAKDALERAEKIAATADDQVSLDKARAQVSSARARLMIAGVKRRPRNR